VLRWIKGLVSNHVRNKIMADQTFWLSQSPDDLLQVLMHHAAMKASLHPSAFHWKFCCSSHVSLLAYGASSMEAARVLIWIAFVAMQAMQACEAGVYKGKGHLHLLEGYSAIVRFEVET